MKLPSLWSSPWMMADPFRREMEDLIRTFDRNPPTLSVGAKAPAINVAETANAIEVTAELPGVEEKDIKVGLEGNRLTISGEKKEESTKDEKDWHVEERSYGSFYRSMSLPFTPADGAVEAHLDKGVLHLTVKKPAEAVSGAKTIEIKPGQPPKQR
jgi:HSP20 family protein